MIDEIKTRLKKQCERGIWSFPENREQEVYTAIDAIKDEAGVELWRQWMFQTFPENAS